MKLVVPDADTIVVRPADPIFSRKKWCILKEGHEQIGICGYLCAMPVEYSTLGEIKKNELCGVCWPYGREK